MIYRANKTTNQCLTKILCWKLINITTYLQQKLILMKVYLNAHTVTNERNPLQLYHICCKSSNRVRVEIMATDRSMCEQVSGWESHSPLAEDALPPVEEHLALLMWMNRVLAVHLQSGMTKHLCSSWSVTMSSKQFQREGIELEHWSSCLNVKRLSDDFRSFKIQFCGVDAV